MSHVTIQTDERGRCRVVGIEENPPEAFEALSERTRKATQRQQPEAAAGVILPEKAASDALKVQPVVAEPAPGALPALVTEAPKSLKCPHCEFVATSNQGRSSHIRARHPGV